MRGALNDDKLERFAVANQAINETICLVYAATPIAVEVFQGFRLADARVPVSLNVLDKRVDAFQRLFVFKLPACIFIPGAGRKDDVHLSRSTLNELVPLGLTALERADGLVEYALVGRREKGVGADGYHFEGQTLADDRLPQEESNSARHIESGMGKKSLGFLAEVWINSNL